MAHSRGIQKTGDPKDTGADYVPWNRMLEGTCAFMLTFEEILLIYLCKGK